ncbi:MAG: circadian clock protein KaiC [Candidatus Magnetominusculus sp. LBB02]|nr:circadian clock protein KaiC [Candidatus Magnetominusculus sp. LBB02]
MSLTNQRIQQDGKLLKSLTGIKGLDEVTFGGLPAGRPTLVCGNPGCGKTLLTVEFLVRGAIEYNEPGVFISFDENKEDIAINAASIGFDLADLSKKGKIFVDSISIDHNQVGVSGGYDLEGLFIRLDYAVNAIGAKRVGIDSIDSLFSGLTQHNLLRSEFKRLLNWLKEKGLTAIVTAERGERALTRNRLEEYIADCVILIDHRVERQILTRRLCVTKYRGSSHGTNEYPFLLDSNGISVLPVTSIGLEYKVSDEHISTGIAHLDTMLDEKGYFCGSTVLVSGTAGTGKTSVALHLANATCARGQRCLYLASEESPHQVIRNARSIGMDLEPFVKQGALRLVASRPTSFGIETHLVATHRLINEFAPSVIIMDPITNYSDIGSENEIKMLMMRLIDLMKASNITSLYTTLNGSDESLYTSSMGISSLMDTWIFLTNNEYSGERTRGLSIIKSRGMSHSNQTRDFLITDKGIKILDAYTGSGITTKGGTYQWMTLMRKMLGDPMSQWRKRLNQ